MAYNPCSVCGEETKYSCLRCSVPVCNRSLNCSVPAEEHLQKEFESVSYCKNCQNDIDKRMVSRSRSVSVSPFSDSTSNYNDSNMSSFSEENLNQNEEDEGDDIIHTAATRIKRKRGKKSNWESEDLDDFVDIIVNDENHKRKLVFQNTACKANRRNYETIQMDLKERAQLRGTVFDKTIEQMRNKFKKLVSECKQANMIFKTATGISNFKDQKNYSKWFDVLFPLIKSRDSCQPDQALEPSAGRASDTEDGANIEQNSEGETAKTSDGTLFVPKRAKKITAELISSIQSLVKNDPTTTLL